MPITVFSFAGPRVGNLRFKERCEELGVKVLRVINVHDKVPTVPGIIANERLKFQKYMEEVMAFPWSYAHVGVELPLDHSRSPFVKVMGMDLGGAHNLELHLHLVDGYNGKGREYCWQQPNKPQRDLALVNKDSDCLKEEFGVPPYWRQDRNKGLVRAVDGRWVVPERSWMEVHPPDTAHYLDQILNMAKSRSLKTA
ncbi:Phospholipase A1-Igamma3, chloroplastic [Asimina triloba]